MEDFLLQQDGLALLQEEGDELLLEQQDEAEVFSSRSFLVSSVRSQVSMGGESEKLSFSVDSEEQIN